jgi:DNA recombination protein RmuC
MNTLTRGRGNLISQANRFVELGVRVKKELPKGIMDQAEVDATEDFEHSGDNDLPDSEEQAIGADNEQE